MAPTELLGEDDPRTSVSRSEAVLGEPDGEKAIFGPRENIFEAFRDETQPIINDPVDGLMRPADGGIAPVALPLSEETMVCLEDARSYVSAFADEVPVEWPNGYTYVPKELQALVQDRYDEAGDERERISYTPDRVVKKWGYTWGVGEGGKIENLVMVKRPKCVHFKAQLSPDGQIDFEDGIVEPLSMYCGAMRSVGGAMMSLESENITSCNMRDPRDLVSEERLTRRIKKKIEQGRNREMVPFLDMAPPKDWRSIADQYDLDNFVLDVPRALLQGVPSTVTVHLFLCSPSTTPHAFVKSAIIVLPDDGWQPDDSFYVGEDRDLPGETGWVTGPWGQPSSGETLLRLKINEPGYKEESDASLWPDFHDPMMRVAIHRQAEFCVAALRRGKSVSIVARDLTHQAAFFAAVIWAKLTRRSGLDALEHIQNEIGAECAPDLSHRVFLRAITETT